jgi:thiamine monophosphate synthase
MKLLAISPGHGCERARWTAVLRSGVDAFLIREKQLEARPLLDLARWCQDTAPEVELWVSDRLEVALAAGCGLHAGESYPEVPTELVSLSRPLHAENQWEARKTSRQLLLSPIFATPGKGAPWGVERLHRFLEALPPAGPSLLALGGMDPVTARDLNHPRLAGFAAIRPFWLGDPRKVVARFREA